MYVYMRRPPESFRRIRIDISHSTPPAQIRPGLTTTVSGTAIVNTVTSRSAVLFDLKPSNHWAPAFDTVFVRFRFSRRNAANQEIHLMKPGRTRQDSLVLGTILGYFFSATTWSKIETLPVRALPHSIQFSLARYATV